MHAANRCSVSERFGRLMIDTIIKVFVGKSVSDACKVDHGIALLQQRLPVKGLDRSGSWTPTMSGPSKASVDLDAAITLQPRAAR